VDRFARSSEEEERGSVIQRPFDRAPFHARSRTERLEGHLRTPRPEECGSCPGMQKRKFGMGVRRGEQDACASFLEARPRTEIRLHRERAEVRRMGCEVRLARG